MRRAFWDPGAGLHGLFEVWSFSKVRALVSSGLGGGSLIYANVLLRKPPETFEPDASDGFLRWPVAPDDLADEYDDVERMLRPNPLPAEYVAPPPAEGGVAKTQQFLAAARASGLDPQLAPIAVTFRASEVAGAEPGVPFGEQQHPRPDPPHLHARRRVRPRVQRGSQEQPRLHLPDPVCLRHRRSWPDLHLL